MVRYQHQSREINELAAALSKCQQEPLFALTGSENPFFKSKYADLSSVWAVARGPLTKNDLAVAQTMIVGERDNPIIVTTLMHKSGQWIRSYLEIPAPKKDPQQFGSAITYGRRYALCAILGICPADDDAQSATEAMSKERKKSNEIRAKSEKVEKPAKKDGTCTKAQFGKMIVMAKENGLTKEELEKLAMWFRKGEKLSKSEASELIDTMGEPEKFAEMCENYAMDAHAKAEPDDIPL